MDTSDMLPYTDPEDVHRLQAEYEQAFRAGGQSELESARIQLVWAMVHSTDQVQVNRGLEMAKLRLADPKVTEKDKRELQYLAAVGAYRLGRYVESRRSLKEVLLVSPDFRQAEQLLSSVEDKILRNGLVGVGIGGAVLGVGLAILFGASRR